MSQLFFSFILAFMVACAPMRVEGTITAPNHVASDWTQKHTALFVATSATLLWDYLQTRRITQACLEINPFMGRCGERIDPDTYFFLLAPIHTLVTLVLPKDQRYIYQGIFLGVEASMVFSNARGGVWGF